VRIREQLRVRPEEDARSELSSSGILGSTNRRRRLHARSSSRSRCRRQDHLPRCCYRTDCERPAACGRQACASRRSPPRKKTLRSLRSRIVGAGPELRQVADRQLAIACIAAGSRILVTLTGCSRCDPDVSESPPSIAESVSFMPLTGPRPTAPSCQWVGELVMMVHR